MEQGGLQECWCSAQRWLISIEWHRVCVSLCVYVDLRRSQGIMCVCVCVCADIRIDILTHTHTP